MRRNSEKRGDWLHQCFDWAGKGKTQVIAYVLGLVSTLGVYLIMSGKAVPMGIFLCLLSFFHMWEFLYNAMFHPETVTMDSFLINHSTEFQFAMSFALAEYVIEAYLFPWLKTPTWITYIATVVAVSGQIIRTLAMATAGFSFNHVIQTERVAGHELITHGIYSILRHPSYFGWFYWSVATQVIMANPLSIIGYAYFTHKFFKERIVDEEVELLTMFGRPYIDYANRTYIGIPGIPSPLADKLKK